MLATPSLSQILDTGRLIARLEARLAGDTPWIGALLETLAFDAIISASATLGLRESREQLRDAIAFAGQTAAMTPALRAWSIIARGAHAPLSTIEATMAPFVDLSGLLAFKGAGDDHLGAAIHASKTAIEATTPSRDAATWLTPYLAADVALARSFKWNAMVPLLTLNPPRRMESEDFTASIAASIKKALIVSADLERRWATLTVAAGKTRSKAALKAAGVFGDHIFVSPLQLSRLLTIHESSARRLCTRLCELEGLREFSSRADWKVFGL